MRLVDQTGYLLSSYRFTSLVDNVAVIKCDYEQVTVSGNPTKSDSEISFFEVSHLFVC